jgi:hypothetical protein
VRKALLLLAVAALLGCPEKNPGVSKAEDDHTLAKLKEAQALGDNVQGPPQPAQDPNQKLADLAAAGPSEGGPRPLPAKNETVHLGTVALKLVGLSTAPTVSNGKLTLSTDDTFLLVKVLAQNVGEREQELDFSLAAVKNGKQLESAIARDAQRVGGTKELRQTFGLGDKQRQELVLIFEVPPDAFGQGLTLSLTSPGVDPVSLPLE